MKNNHLILLLMNFVSVTIFGSYQLETIVNNEQRNAVDFNKLKHALLINNLKKVSEILDSNPSLLSYVDPKTGRMLIHEIFMHAYPAENVYHVLLRVDESVINAKDALGNRPLHYCINNLHNYSDQEMQEIFKLLARKYARPLSKNNEGITPLHLASGNRRIQVLEYIMSMLPNDYKTKGYLDLKDNTGKTSLMYAADLEDRQNIKRLLNSGASFDQEFVQYLKNQGKDSDCIANHVVCAKKFNPDFYTIFLNLLRSGVDINKKKDGYGNILLHYAMNNFIFYNEEWHASPRLGNDEMVTGLLALGADSQLINAFGQKPDVYGNYQSLVNYYKHLKNSIEMNEERETLFGESVMNAYELWLEGKDSGLLRTMICPDDTNHFSKLIRMKAQSFFKPEFVQKICS